jgi:Heparinase II/III-like protein
MPPILPLLRTVYALGLKSVLKVALYRIGIRFGFNPVLSLKEDHVAGPFFSSDAFSPTGLTTSPKWIDKAHYFGWAEFPISGNAPDWHLNPFTGKRVEATAHWSKLPDFSDSGDIKIIWEPSRFDWVINNAERAREGDVTSLERINIWLEDWTDKNPAYRGPNWKCGQEASIRVMHLAVAAIILDQVKNPLPALAKLIEIHLRRIAPTLSYAVGQDNNHGTSEAAALFIGGSWLKSLGHPQGGKWADIGRNVLEERVATLIAPDGTFSQYSMVYQRVLIGTLIIAERLRHALGLPEFSGVFQKQAALATRWLHTFTDADNGDVPNIGANDGASLLPLSDTAFRDFRSSIQMASALFCKARAYPQTANVDAAAHRLGIALPDECLPKRKSMVFSDGGFVALNNGSAWGYLRFPRFVFRPSQADALHFDLWHGGKALLYDAGSFSYAADPETYAYYAGTKGHNTIMFDDSDQMSRLGRFLYADWLKTDGIPALLENDSEAGITAGYRSRSGIKHSRAIRLKPRSVTVTDTISGFKKYAVMRWRLPKGEWSISGNEVRAMNFVLKFEASMAIERAEIVTGSHSTHYLSKEDCPILEIEVREPGTITTFFEW